MIKNLEYDETNEEGLRVVARGPDFKDWTWETELQVHDVSIAAARCVMRELFDTGYVYLSIDDDTNEISLNFCSFEGDFDVGEKLISVLDRFSKWRLESYQSDREEVRAMAAGLEAAAQHLRTKIDAG